MTELQDKINKAIDEALPAELGKVLRARIDLVDQLEKENKDLEAVGFSQSKRIRELEALNAEQNKMLAGHKALDIREGEVKSREIRLDVTALEVKLDAEKRVSSALDGALKGLVRNTEFRRNFFGNEQIPSGQFGTVQSNKSGGETTTQE